jgi:hypothetical protein
VPERNELLRRARERILSPDAPGEGLSRQELAELTNRWIFESRGIVVTLDANYIGKLEAGKIRWPQALYREAFRAVLNADSDRQLGFRRPRRRPTAAAGERPHLAGRLGSVPPIPWMDPVVPLEPTPVPAKIDSHDIEQTRLATATFRAWDNAYGGGLARDAAMGQLRWCAQLLRADCPEPYRPPLFAAVAELAGVAGFMAFDACAHTDARRLFGFSLRCAEESHDWHLRAATLSMMARQAIWCGQPDEGLTYVETALVRSDRLTATERASLHTLRARALAKLDRPQETHAAIGAADDEFAHANPAEDPVWMAFYDHAQHQGDTGHALWDLSIDGQPTQAAQRLAYAVTHHGDAYVRSRTMSTIKLASLAMATGDPREAAAIGHTALDTVKRLRSRRAIDEVLVLHGFAARRGDVVDATELHDRITETVAAADQLR